MALAGGCLETPFGGHWIGHILEYQNSSSSAPSVLVQEAYRRTFIVRRRGIRQTGEDAALPSRRASTQAMAEIIANKKVRVGRKWSRRCVRAGAQRR